MYKNGMYLPGDIRNRYEQYEPMPPKGSNPSLEFNMEKGYYKKFNGDAWLFVNYNISKFGSSSDDAEIMARCTSAACLSTTDISKLPAGKGWEVATKKCLCGEKSCDASACAFQDVGESVSIGCCEEKPEVARCDSWTWDQCEKLTPSIWHGNHCEDSGCCTLYHPTLWQAECKRRFFPGGTRCKPFKPEVAENILV